MNAKVKNEIKKLRDQMNREARSGWIDSSENRVKAIWTLLVASGYSQACTETMVHLQYNRGPGWFFANVASAWMIENITATKLQKAGIPTFDQLVQLKVKTRQGR